jgi:hypothetical protein
LGGTYLPIRRELPMSPSLFLAAGLLLGQTIAGLRPAGVLTQPLVEAPCPPASTSLLSTREGEAPQVESQPEVDPIVKTK